MGVHIVKGIPPLHLGKVGRVLEIGKEISMAPIRTLLPNMVVGRV